MPLSAGESKNSDSAPGGAALMHIEGPRSIAEKQVFADQLARDGTQDGTD